MQERVDGQVFVREFRATSDANIYNVAFQQQVMRPINNNGAMLNVLMAGHSSFGSPYQTRIAYQNMSRQQFEAFGLDQGVAFPQDWEPRLVVHEFCAGDEVPQSLRTSFPTVYKTAKYQPRNWFQGENLVTEKPKMSAKVEGREQEMMTRNGAPIYRNVYFTVSGLDQNDYLVQHTNSVNGTTNAIKETSQSADVFAAPAIPLENQG